MKRNHTLIAGWFILLAVIMTMGSAFTPGRSTGFIVTFSILVFLFGCLSLYLFREQKQLLTKGSRPIQ